MLGIPFRFVYNSELRLYDHYMNQYADVLYRWNLLGKRAEVIKFLSVPQKPHKGVGEWSFVFFVLVTKRFRQASKWKGSFNKLIFTALYFIRIPRR